MRLLIAFIFFGWMQSYSTEYIALTEDGAYPQNPPPGITYPNVTSSVLEALWFAEMVPYVSNQQILPIEIHVFNKHNGENAYHLRETSGGQIDFFTSFNDRANVSGGAGRALTIKGIPETINGVTVKPTIDVVQNENPYNIVEFYYLHTFQIEDIEFSWMVVQWAIVRNINIYKAKWIGEHCSQFAPPGISIPNYARQYILQNSVIDKHYIWANDNNDYKYQIDNCTFIDSRIRFTRNDYFSRSIDCRNNILLNTPIGIDNIEQVASINISYNIFKYLDPLYTHGIDVYYLFHLGNPFVYDPEHGEVLGSQYIPLNDLVRNQGNIIAPCYLGLDLQTYSLLPFSIAIGKGNSTIPEDYFDEPRPSPSNENPDVGAMETSQSVPNSPMVTFLDPPGESKDEMGISEAISATFYAHNITCTASEGCVSPYGKNMSCYDCCAAHVYYTTDGSIPVVNGTNTFIAAVSTTILVQPGSVIKYFGVDQYGIREVIGAPDNCHTTSYSNVVKSIEIATPSNGSVWNIGDFHGITWRTTGTIGHVNIQYLKADQTWGTIASSINNYDAFFFYVPYDAISGAGTIFRVSDASDATIYAEVTVNVVEPIPAFTYPTESVFYILPGSYGVHTFMQEIRTNVTYVNGVYIDRSDEYKFVLGPSAPAGLTIDPQYGHISWNVPNDFGAIPLTYTFRISLTDISGATEYASKDIILQLKGKRELQPLDDPYEIVSSEGSLQIPYADGNPSWNFSIYPYSWSIVNQATLPTAANIQIDDNGLLTWSQSYTSFDKLTIVVRATDTKDADEETYYLRLLPQEFYPKIVVENCNCGAVTPSTTSITCDLTVLEDEQSTLPAPDATIYYTTDKDNMPIALTSPHFTVDADGLASAAFSNNMITFSTTTSSPAIQEAFSVAPRYMHLNFFAITSRGVERNPHRLAFRFENPQNDCEGGCN